MEKSRPGSDLRKSGFGPQLCDPGHLASHPSSVEWAMIMAHPPESCWKDRGVCKRLSTEPCSCTRPLFLGKRRPAGLSEAWASFSESNDHAFVPCSFVPPSTHSSPFLSSPLPAGPQVGTAHGEPSPTWVCPHGAPSTRQRQTCQPAWASPSLIHKIQNAGREAGKNKETQRRPLLGSSCGFQQEEF